MATDGGQVRDANKVYAEQNHSRTCTTTATMTSGLSVVASEARVFALHATANKQGILITDANGNAAFVAVPDGAAGYNKLLATDANGNLTWIAK